MCTMLKFSLCDFLKNLFKAILLLNFNYYLSGGESEGYQITWNWSCELSDVGAGN